MKKKVYIPLIIVFVLVLAVISFLTTFGHWDGAIPSARFQIRVQNERGQPISDATLSVYRKTGIFGLNKDLSYGFPIEEFTENSQPKSLSDGVITVSHIAIIPEVGGASFALFWVIPISFGDLDFVVIIEAPNYRAEVIDYRELYSNCDKKPTIVQSGPPPICKYMVRLVQESE